MFVFGVLTEHYMRSREKLGHLHYFSLNSALATLNYTGYKVIDKIITDDSWPNFKKRPGFKRLIHLVISRCLHFWAPELKMKFIGGSSLMVLAMQSANNHE